MTQFSASVRAQYPKRWHMKYWLNIFLIGKIRLQDKYLMLIRIEMENQKALHAGNTYIDLEEWLEFKVNNKAEYLRYWEQRTLEDEDYQAYIHDLDRMLEDKEEKMIEFLCSQIAAAQDLTGPELNDILRRMVQERTREAQAKEAEAKN